MFYETVNFFISIIHVYYVLYLPCFPMSQSPLVVKGEEVDRGSVPRSDNGSRGPSNVVDCERPVYGVRSVVRTSSLLNYSK